MSESSDDSIISNSLSSQSTDSDYIPSLTPETEDYTSQESEAGHSETGQSLSSEPLSEAESFIEHSLTPTESEYSTDSESFLI